jgi:arylsulfatase A-like enzyme
MVSWRATASAGFLLGGAAGLRVWNAAWPRLALLEGCRWAALGWLVGVIVGLLGGWLRSRRVRPVAETARWRRRLATLVALAPLALWATLALPGGLLRKALLGRGTGDTRPNLILISIDALRGDHLRPDLMPDLTALAREGTRYASAYSTAPWTIASLASLFTSLPPSRSAVKLLSPTGREIGFRLNEESPLLPERLSRAGYLTAAELTNHFLSKDYGWNRGFDCYRNESEEDRPHAETIPAEEVTTRAAQWLRLNRREPFFLWVHYLDPHVPYASPSSARVRAKYPKDWTPELQRWTGWAQRQPEPVRNQFQRFVGEMYDEEVRYSDRWLGELLGEIRRLGLYDNSAIVVTADHGEEMFEHLKDGGPGHGDSLHEQALHVPLVVKWPRGVPADPVVKQTVALPDLHDTLLRLAGVKGVEGRGLPSRDGGAGDEVFCEWILYGSRESAALVRDDYKVIYYPQDRGRPFCYQVYDRRKDREERRDLAPRGVAPELQTRLRKLAEEALATRRAMSAQQGTPGRKLSEQELRELRSLGYLK